MHTQTYGEGERLFVGYHGWGSEQGASFKQLLAFMPEDVRFMGVDLPGCGKSEAPASWTWGEVCAESAAHFESITRDQKAVLVGSCSGSFNALEVALRQPDRVAGLVLLEPFAFMPWFFSIFLKPLTGRLLYRMVFDNPLGKAMTSRSMRRQGLNEDFDMVGAFGMGTSLEHAYHYLQFYGQLTEHTIYAPVRAPVRIIHGQKSFKAIHASVKMWRELWPQLELSALEGVGHMLSQEAPEQTAAQIFGFLRGSDAL